MGNDFLNPVQDTFYKDYFEGNNCGTIFLLGKKNANYVWNNEISPNTTSYFDLPDDCWVVSHKSILIGNWMDSYGDDASLVSIILKQAVTWDEKTIVKFFVKKDTVFECKWEDFLASWDDFISVEDDCPLVIPDKNSNHEAILFTPIGNIIKIG